MRSPEEYAYLNQTEKVDIYSLGNVFFGIATGKDLFWNKDEKERKNTNIQKFIINGERTPIPDDLKNSTDPYEQALLKAIEMCWKQDPKERPTARELQDLFMNELEKQGVPKSEW